MYQPTDIQIYKIAQPKGNTVAYVTVTFDDLLVVRNLRIVQGKNGLFVGMPSKPGKDGKFYDDVYFLGSFDKGKPGYEIREKLQNIVLAQYNKTGGNEGPAFEDQTSATGGGGSARPGFGRPADDDVPF